MNLAPGQTLERIKWGQGRQSTPDTAVVDHIICVDGYRLSVQASKYHYANDSTGSSPYWSPKDSPTVELPWQAFEVMTYGGRPEPWHCTAWHEGYDRHEDHPVCDGWETRSSDGEHGPFGFVPETVVRALIDSHGGEQT